MLLKISCNYFLLCGLRKLNVRNCIDLTGATQLEAKYAAQLDEIAEEIRTPFVKLIIQISEPYGNNLDWWVTPIACRNTYACNLFQNLCRLMLILRIIEEKKIEEIIVDSPALAKILKKITPQSILIRTKFSVIRWKLNSFIAIARCLFGCLYKFAFRLLAAKLTARKTLYNSSILGQSVTLIDTVVYSHSFQDEYFKDRHYPSLREHIDNETNNNLFWAPYYYKINNYFTLFKNLRKSKEKFLLAEDYLHLTDYLFAISHFKRCKVPKHVYNFQGVDVSLLVREAYTEHLANSSSIEALLRFRFAKRLSENEVRINKVIEWFENQEIDHGSVAGWKTYYPFVPIIGYQGFFASRTYLCMFPISLEKQLELLPHTVAVLGKEFIEPLKEFCPDLQVLIAPAFRFHSMWLKQVHSPNSKYFNVFVPLPILKNDYLAILGIIKDSLSLLVKSINRPVRFLFKQHPASKEKLTTSYFPKYPETLFEFTDLNIEKAFIEADVVVGAASSTCMEAVLRNIPVVIIARSAHVTQNPIPKKIRKELWSICYNSTELSEKLFSYSKENLSKVKAQNRTEFDWQSILTIEPTKNSVSNFLNYSPLKITTPVDV